MMRIASVLVLALVRTSAQDDDENAVEELRYWHVYDEQILKHNQPTIITFALTKCVPLF